MFSLILSQAIFPNKFVHYRAAGFVIGLIFFSLVISQPAQAQSSGATTGTIVGTVKDQQGASLVGATIIAKQLETNLIRTVTVEEDGIYRLIQLPPADYEIKVEADGFISQTTLVQLSLGTTALFHFTMTVGGAEEVVEVVANSIVTEGKTESSTNIDRGRIDNLPINRRNFLDFSLTAPRVVADGIRAQGVSATSGLSFNGQSARFNNITIDGLDNNDLGSGSVRSTFGQDAVQEFQVVSDSYSAEFGRALAGIVNIITRVGSNAYHGNLFLLNRNDETSARDVFSSFEPNYEQYQFGALLSGPIKKDRAFFFSSFERLSIKQSNIVTISDATINSMRRQKFDLRNGPIPFSVDTTTLLARADLQLSSHRLWTRYNGGFSYNGAFEPFGGLIADSTAGLLRLDDNSIAFSDTYLNTDLNLVNETRFLYSRRDQDIDTPDNGPQVRIFAPEGGIIFGRAASLPQPREERIYQFVNNLTLVRGRHQLKLGGDFQYVHSPAGKTTLPFFTGGGVAFSALDFSLFSGIPNLPPFSALESFDPSLRTPAQRAFLMLLANLLPTRFSDFPKGLPLADLALPRAYTQGFGDASVEFKEKLFSAFLQDDLKLKHNLLVKLGVRYDIFRVGTMPHNNGNLSPRLALAYAPAFFPKLMLRASYGIFVGAPIVGTAASVEVSNSGKFKIPLIPFPFSILPFALPGHHFPESAEIPSGVTVTPQLSALSVFQQDLRNSYTQQANFGLDLLAAQDTIVSLNYQYVRGIKILGQRNINPVVRPVPGNLLESLIKGRVDPTRGEVFQFESSFDSYYHGLTVSLKHRY
ncbi:MAG: TonB-dependent receptor, partial [Acidobacteriota bacterium]